MKKLLLLLCALLLTACNKSASTTTSSSSTAERNYSQITSYYAVQWQFQEDMRFYVKYQNADIVKEWTVYLTGFYRLSVSSTPISTFYECEINNSQAFDYYLIII